MEKYLKSKVYYNHDGICTWFIPSCYDTVVTLAIHVKKCLIATNNIPTSLEIISQWPQDCGDLELYRYTSLWLNKISQRHGNIQLRTESTVPSLDSRALVHFRHVDGSTKLDEF